NRPFIVNDQLKDWECSGVRRAGVSSFGVGGTNVHAILEEYKKDSLPAGQSRKSQLFIWSAKSVISREEYATRLLDLGESNPALALEEVAFSHQATRASFNH